MADQVNRRSPRLNNNRTPDNQTPNTQSPRSASPRTSRTLKPRKGLPPSQLSLPAASAKLPTPLPTTSPTDQHSPLLPAAHISTCSESDPPAIPSSPALPRSTSHPVASPCGSACSDDMPASELAPGITIYAPGKLPTVEDSRLAAQSLGDPRNCIRLASKIRAYAKASNLADGAFMDSALHAFESPKMQGDLRQAAARLQLSLPTLTFAELETVLKAAFMRGTSTAFVDSFRALTRLPSESPHDFLDRIEDTNFYLPVSQRDSQDELIRRTSKSFSTSFKNFCFLNTQFKDLTDWTVPDVDEDDPASVRARDASIGTFKENLDLAWGLHVSATSDRNNDLQSAIDAVLSRRGITSNSRKRGLSTTSHTAQLPEPKRSSSFSSNSANANTRGLPPMPGFATVNAIGYGNTSRPRNDLRGHRETLTKYNGCFSCFMLFADHGSRDCPSRDLPFSPPNFDLNSAAAHQIIEEELLPNNIRQVSLADLIQRAQRRHGRTAAVTAPNNIPVAARVNAVPNSGAHMSANSSFE
ncbi:hypothetical protein HDZ31DRAFT_50216, partial [Schizophyllum fasciatum]